MISSSPINRVVCITCLFLLCAAQALQARSITTGKTETAQNTQAGKADTTPVALTDKKAESQYRLGMKYYYGKGISANHSKGIELLTLSANSDNRDAQYELFRLKKEEKSRLISKEKALYWLEKAALNGHPDAMTEQGHRLLAEGRREDRWEKAFVFFNRAAQSGQPEALRILGYYYEYGIGVKKNLDKALEFYERSAAQNYSGGMSALARFYERGIGVNQNSDRAYELNRKALESNDPMAQFAFGNYYRTGKHVEKDNAKAFGYFQKSASQAYIPAIEEMVRIYDNGLLNQKIDPSKAKIWVELYKKHYDFLPSKKFEFIDFLNILWDSFSFYGFMLCVFIILAIRRDHYLGKVARGFAYYKKGEYKLAHDIFTRKWAKINPDTFTTLGEMYLYGQGVEKNPEMAMSWFLKGSNKRRHRSQFLIGLMYEEGIGVERNRITAAYWYAESADSGNADAANNLGVLYYTGKGVRQNMETAYKWLEKSALANCETAKANLACLYHEGKGVPKDEVRAFEITSALAQTGNLPARYNLALYWRHVNPTHSDQQKTLQMIIDCANEGYRPAMQDLITVYEKGELGEPVNETLARHWKDKLDQRQAPTELKALTYQTGQEKTQTQKT